MPSIGPELPPHLRQSTNEPERPSDEDEAAVIGPQIPTGPSNTGDDDDEDEDDYAPELPPELLATRSAPAGPSAPTVVRSDSNGAKRVAGPSLPSYPPIYDPKYHSVYQDDDDDDDDVGPRPLPAGMKHAETNAAQEFMEREERRRILAEEAAKPKAIQREEWMLVPPSSSDLLGSRYILLNIVPTCPDEITALDPKKLTKARQFSKSTAVQSTSDTSLWTETPAERQQRLADEVSGKKRRAADTHAEVEAGEDIKRRKKEEAAIRRGVDDYTQRRRGPALLAQHTASGKADSKEEDDLGIWDHSRDMAIGGRLMDDSKRAQLVREAQGLGDRFGTGKSGGFL
ncbi:hypothetical protein H0H93_001973 [Arthromyces matolae]|nr:hypothetical protein H0H93_001973 [Arthromyces matolae]